MASLAVFAKNLLAMKRYSNIFRINTTVEKKKILHAINPLPYSIIDDVIIGKMAIHTFDIPVKPSQKPSLILQIHDMAGIAIIWL
jgi:hypothetical protein